jgi:hypothetical protein
MIRMNVFYLWEMKSYWRCSLAFRMLFTESWNEDIARPHAPTHGKRTGCGAFPGKSSER